MGFESHKLRSLTRFCFAPKSKICLFMRINTKSPRYCSANRRDVIPQPLILFRKCDIISTESLARKSLGFALCVLCTPVLLTASQKCPCKQAFLLHGIILKKKELDGRRPLTEGEVGRYVDLSYHILANPASTSEFKAEKAMYGSMEYAPSTKRGENKQGFYLSELGEQLATLLRMMY